MITVVCNLTLDGVMQAPGRADEDVRGGFPYGGWAMPYSQDAMGRVLRPAGRQSGGDAARAADLRGLRGLLAEAAGQPLHGCAQQAAEVRRLVDADGPRLGQHPRDRSGRHRRS